MAIGGCRGKLTTFFAPADSLALTREGALGAMKRKSDFSKNCWRIERVGVRAPLRSDAAGRHVLGLASFGKRGVSSSPRGATDMVACVSLGDASAGHGLPTSGISFAESEDKRRQFSAPRRSQTRNPQPQNLTF